MAEVAEKFHSAECGLVTKKLKRNIVNTIVLKVYSSYCIRVITLDSGCPKVAATHWLRNPMKDSSSAKSSVWSFLLEEEQRPESIVMLQVAAICFGWAFLLSLA
jgi:hypothetical protein